MTFRFGAAAVIVAAFASLASAQPAPVTSDDVAAVVTPTVATVTTETVETPFVGTFDLSGALTGSISIGRKDDTLSLNGTAGGIGFSATAAVKDGRTWKLPLGTDSRGIVNLIGGVSSTKTHATRFLVVKDAGKGNLTGSLELAAGQATAVTFTRKKEALVMWGTYMNAMKVYAQQCSAYYKAKGYVIHEVPGDWIQAVDTLVAAEESGHTFMRVVIVSHGGWDGPMFEGQFCQMSGNNENTDGFYNYMQALRRGTTIDAKYIFSCCHQGGSDRFETFNLDYRYTDDVAARTGRIAAGPMGETSTEWSKILCMAVEGEGPARQEMRISSPSGNKVFKGGTVPGPSTGTTPPIANAPLGVAH